jgi:hypothetical protein
MDKIVFVIEYEIPPLRAIYYTSIKAKNEEQAKEAFFIWHPSAKIRKVDSDNE